MSPQGYDWWKLLKDDRVADYKINNISKDPKGNIVVDIDIVLKATVQQVDFKGVVSR